MSRTFDEKIGELRVAQAYTELLSSPGTIMISVARTGNYEIRIHQLSQSDSDGEAAIWMELFDRSIGLPVDSSRCREIEDVLIVFKEFVAQLKFIDEAPGLEAD